MKRAVFLFFALMLVVISSATVLAAEAPDLPCHPEDATFYPPTPEDSDQTYLLQVTCLEVEYWFRVRDGRLRMIEDLPVEYAEEPESMVWNEIHHYDGFLTDHGDVIYSGYRPVRFHRFGEYRPFYTLVVPAGELGNQVLVIRNGEALLSDGDDEILDAVVQRIQIGRDRYRLYVTVVRRSGEISFLDLP